jgi:hypothetical protein
MFDGESRFNQNVQGRKAGIWRSWRRQSVTEQQILVIRLVRELAEDKEYAEGGIQKKAIPLGLGWH